MPFERNSYFQTTGAVNRFGRQLCRSQIIPVTGKFVQFKKCHCHPAVIVAVNGQRRIAEVIEETPEAVTFARRVQILKISALQIVENIFGDCKVLLFFAGKRSVLCQKERRFAVAIRTHRFYQTVVKTGKTFVYTL